MKKFLVVLFSIPLLLAGCSSPAATPTPPANAQSSYNCSVQQGFNFEKDAQVLVGFVNSISIGGTTINADLNVTDPENIANIIKVSGVMSDIRWQGGYADPVIFSAHVSTDNKNIIATLQHKSLSNTDVNLRFTVYDYDPKSKKYFKCFYDDATLKGLVGKSGGELMLSVNMDQSMEVVSPKNYTFDLGVMPQDIDQAINMAVSVSDKFSKKWGVGISR